MPESIRSGEALVWIDSTKVTDQVNALFPFFRNVAYLVQMLALKRFFIVIHKKSLAGWRHPKESIMGFGGMPPKAKKEKAPKEKKPKAEGEKKKGRKKRRSESYSIYIYKVLKQVALENCVQLCLGFVASGSCTRKCESGIELPFSFLVHIMAARTNVLQGSGVSGADHSLNRT